MKRLALLALTFYMNLSLMFLPICAYGNTDEIFPDEFFTLSKSILSDMNMWKDFDETRTYITRAETAACMCMRWDCYGPEFEIFEAPSHVPSYSDVTYEHWARPWISYVSFIGDPLGSSVMQGDGNGFFRPDDYITYQELVKTLVTELGWSAYAKIELNGYPDGYWKVSKMLGINPFDESKMQEFITEEDAIVLIYKSLFVPSLFRAITTDPSYNLGVSFPLYDAYNVRGYAKRIDDNSITIDNVIYYGKVSEDFVEGNVVCFYKKNLNEKVYEIKCCYPVSSLDFDNPQPIDDALKKWERIDKFYYYMFD